MITGDIVSLCFPGVFSSSGSSSANQDTTDPISEALLGMGRATPTPSPTSQPPAMSDRERELQEQDELQMALAISLSEQNVSEGCYIMCIPLCMKAYVLVIPFVCFESQGT